MTELRKKVIDNIAPVTVDECVYMGNGKTLREQVLPWKGLKWVAFGDSITDASLTQADRKYCDIIAEKTGITMLNFGKGGTGYKRTEDKGTCFYQRMSGIPSDTNILTIFGSVNEWSLLNPHAGNYDGFVEGNANDTIESNSLCGYINKAIDVAIATAPDVKIGLITPPTSKLTNRLDLIRSAICKVGEYRCIPVLDLWKVCQLRPNDPVFAQKYYYDYSSEVVVHPSNAGHEWIAPIILKFMESII